MYSRSRGVKGQGAGVVRPVMVAIVCRSHCRPNGAQSRGRGREAAFGASPPKRMIASWSGPGMGPTEYKGAARVFARNGGLPSVRTDRLNQRRSQCHATAFSIPQKHHEQTGLGRSFGSLSRNTTVPARVADADGRANDRCRAPDLPYSGAAPKALLTTVSPMSINWRRIQVSKIARPYL